ncbi:helix-turn-helix domain-containing protein [Variovorax sp. Varisp41]|uniref:helix-turn-helix domain-containing protein n=1 Tax=Variovorax sp. Varisp41 TaxID=3243033 RepID=UPI0039B4819E
MQADFKARRFTSSMTPMQKHMGPQVSGLAHPQPTADLSISTQLERIAALRAICDRNSSGTSSAQRARLLEALRSMKYVTTFEAMRYLDIFDPRPRKLELTRKGYRIVTTWCVVKTESGYHHRIGVYSLG